MPALPPPELVFLPAPPGINHGAGLAALGGQALLACWYSGRTEAGRDAVILCARSDAAGGRWSAPAAVSTPQEQDLTARAPAKSVGNVVLARDGSGRLVMIAGEVQSRRIAGLETCRSWRCGRINFRLSTDDGRTWSAPTRLDDRPGALPRSRPLADLLPVYQEAGPASVLRLDLSKLMPGQRPAADVLPIPASSHLRQPSLAPLNGRVAAYLRDHRRRFVHVAWMGPGGAWSAPRPTDLPNPDSAIEAFAAGPGRVAVIYNPSRTDRRSLALSFSEDGEHFPRGCLLVPGGAAGEVAYPALARLGEDWALVFSAEGKRGIAFMRLTPALLAACARASLAAG